MCIFAFYSVHHPETVCSNAHLILCRQAWALVGVINSGNFSCNESVREYENHSTGGKALAQREFFTFDGQKFSVTAFSEWNEGRKVLSKMFSWG